MNAVEVRDVHRTYQFSADHQVSALRGVTLEVEQGQFVSIVGRSGSGKSTLLNMIGGLDRPSQGRVVVDGADLSSLSSDQLAKFRQNAVGMIFQSFNLIPSMTAQQNVALPLAFAGLGKSERQSRALEVLEQVGLGDRARHKPTQLSGGEQQRVAISRALVTRPRMLLADEPTGNLDTHTAEEILGLIKQLNEDGLTVLMVTHDADAATQYSNRVVTLVDGLVGFSEV